MEYKIKTTHGVELDLFSIGAKNITLSDLAKGLAYTAVKPLEYPFFVPYTEVAMYMADQCETNEDKLDALLTPAFWAYSVLNEPYYCLLAGHADTQPPTVATIIGAIYERFGRDIRGCAFDKFRKAVAAFDERCLSPEINWVPDDAYTSRKNYLKYFNKVYPGLPGDRFKFMRTRIDDYPHFFEYGNGEGAIMSVGQNETVTVRFDDGDEGVAIYRDDIKII